MGSVEAAFQKNKGLRLAGAAVLALLFIALMPPVQISYTSFYLAKGRYIKLGICLVLYALFLLDTVRQRALDPLVPAYLIYGSTIVLSSLLMQNGLADAVWTYGIAPGGMILLIKYSLRYFGKEAVCGLFLVTLAYGVVYLFLAKTGYGNEIEGLRYWVLARASFMNYLPVCLLSCFCMQEAFLERFRFSGEGLILYLLIGIVCGFGYVLGKSLTTLAVAVLFGCYLLFVPGKNRRRIPVLLLILVYLLVWCGLMTIETVNEAGALGSTLDTVGKSLTFTGRTPIWKATREWITKRPVFGYGAEYFAHYVENEHPHNELLYVLFRRGLLGLAALVLMIAVIIKQINGCRNNYLRNGLVWFLFCLMVGGLFEVYDIIPMMALLSIAYYAAGKNGETVHGSDWERTY